MSILISSDDSDATVELPEVDLAAINSIYNNFEKFPSLNEENEKEDQFQNNVVDLTDEDIVLDASANSPEINIIPSDVELSSENDDHDALFDEIFPRSSIASSQASVSESTSSGVNSCTASSQSTATSECSGGSKKKREIDDITKVDKAQKKKTLTEERVRKKQRLLEEKAARRDAQELNKIYRPSECMKYMCVEMHPTLSEAWYCADVRRELEAAGGRLAPPSAAPPSAAPPSPAPLVRWSRRRAADGQLQLGPCREVCDKRILVMCADDIAPMVQQRNVAKHVAKLQDDVGGSLTLVVFGVKDYFKSSSRKKHNQTSVMSEIDLEMAFTDLLVSTGCDAVLVDTPNELALLIVHITKAIAKEPYKKAKRAYDEQAEFYMKGDNRKSVTVDKDGHGLSRLWQQMLAILPQSSLDSARAIAAQYQSPLALYEALQLPDSVEKLADIGVSRAAVPGVRARRIGPEFSRKLNLLFTSDSGDVLLD